VIHFAAKVAATSFLSKKEENKEVKLIIILSLNNGKNLEWN